MSTTNRRKFLGRRVAVAAAAKRRQRCRGTGEQKLTKRVLRRAGARLPKPGSQAARFNRPSPTATWSSSRAGIHSEGDIKVHTEKVLESIRTS